MLLQVTGVKLPRPEVGLVHDPPVERARVHDPVDHQLVERASHTGDRRIPVWGVDDELAEERVVMEADLVAPGDAAIPAHARAAGDSELVDHTGRRQEIAERVLSCDAALDAVPGVRRRVQGGGELFAGRDTQLGVHEVEAGDHLGDGMLHLQACIHLEEVERAVDDQELYRARAAIGRGARGGDRGRAHLLAKPPPPDVLRNHQRGQRRR